MLLDIAKKSDTGRLREVNEDSCVVMNGTQLDNRLDMLCVVADGLGGGRAGDVASMTAVKTISEAAYEMLSERNGRTGALDTARLMETLIVRANARVTMRQVERAELRGMATTCVAGFVQGSELIVGNVGDSRAYLLRYGQPLRQITDDHSDIWEEVIAGNLSREEARNHRFRNRINRAIGLKSDVRPDVFRETLQEGDAVLLCSDGLTTELDDAMIESILASAPNAHTACEQLVNASLRQGGRDNITVVVLHYGRFLPQPERAPSPETFLVEEDAPTDPNQDWKRATTRRESRFPAYGLDDEESDSDSDFEEEEARGSARSRNGMSGLSLSLIILLLVLVIAEGVALYLAQKNRTVIYPKIKPLDTTIPTGPGGSTEYDVQYVPPMVLYAGPIREYGLAVDGAGNAIVIGKDGRYIRVDPLGKATPLPNMVTEPDTETGSGANRASSGRAARSSADGGTKRPPVIYVADTAGNRFQLNFKEKCIEKYNLVGTRKDAGIGKGKLVAPTALAIDPVHNNLYVIDNHQLKYLEALDTEAQFRQSQAISKPR